MVAIARSCSFAEQMKVAQPACLNSSSIRLMWLGSARLPGTMATLFSWAEVPFCGKRLSSLWSFSWMFSMLSGPKRGCAPTTGTRQFRSITSMGIIFTELKSVTTQFAGKYGATLVTTSSSFFMGTLKITMSDPGIVFLICSSVSLLLPSSRSSGLNSLNFPAHNVLNRVPIWPEAPMMQMVAVLMSIMLISF